MRAPVRADLRFVIRFLMQNRVCPPMALKLRNCYLICVNYVETLLSEYCIVADHYEDNDLYSCIECRNSENFILVKKYNNVNDCYIRKDELENCEEAFEDEIFANV